MQVLQLSLVPAHGQWAAVDALPLELPPTAAWQRWVGTAGLHCYVFRASFARCATLAHTSQHHLGAPSPTPRHTILEHQCATPHVPTLPLPTLPAFGRSYMTRAFYRNGKWLVLGSLRNEQGQVDLGRFAAMGSEVRSPIGLKAHPFTPTSSLRPTPTPPPPLSPRARSAQTFL